MATKQLRLDVAQLTDVGRKREHNEDNMAYVIPKDQQVMAKKGALFIVADGMGGHAAGEVASEIAVDTVSNVYYQDDSDDAATSLLQAIKRANALIHQRAAENMLRSGMGTTCVSAVLRGNMAYIANVGDSRAYLVRNGQVKQVSQDHSWVAEQVRAGLLTEDQARTHAQRNVITRCLGTQPDVDIDVFPELLEEHDALVLCTDGLSGLVSDDEIRRIVAQSAPQESVYHLVERANENGGPDNITAIVISVQEVGWEPPNVRHPVLAGTNGRETEEDTIVLGVTPGSATQAPPILDNGYAMSSPPAFSGSTQVSPDTIATAPQPVMRADRTKRNRLFYPTLALVALLILGVIGGGAYLYQTLNSNSHADTHLQDAQSLISKANGEVATNPTLALADLANAQKMLRSVQQNNSFSDAQHHKALGLLQGDLTRSVQQAITSYNKQSAITALCSSNVTGTPLNIASTAPQPSAIAMVQGKSSTLLYALGTDGKVYQRVSNGLLAVPLPLSSTAKVQGMASNGSQLVLLVAQPIKATPNFAYSLNLLPVGQPTQVPQNQNQLKFAANVPIDAKLVPSGQVPQLIASTSTDVYVVIDAGATQSTVQILDYAPNKAGKALAQVTSFPFTFSRAIVSMAAFPNHQLFFLLADGSIQSLQFATTNQAPTSVFVQNAIAQPLANSGVPFTWQMSVPTVTPGGSKSLSVPGTTSTSALAVSLVNTVPHLFVMDVMLNRILELTPVGDNVATATTGTTTPTPKSTSTGGGAISDATPITLSLVKQYASSPLFTQGKSLAVDTQGANVNVLTQSSATSSPNVVAFSTNAPTGCV
nr:Stp1/IreP family PP2C-type Ser/Thr phosphatase [Ktedonobacteraceae bacterium]